MRKPVSGLEEQRRAEILNACEKLYQEKGFRAVSVKDISAATSFSRPSIYNYFATKEEIFLGLLTREYALWAEDVQRVAEENEVLSAEELASALAHTLEKRILLLKISAMNLYEIEENSSLERLKEYKVAFKAAMEAVTVCVKQFLGPSQRLADLIQYAFFPFTYGIYPYTTPTAKQMKAMDAVGIRYQKLSVYQITDQFLRNLFQS